MKSVLLLVITLAAISVQSLVVPVSDASTPPRIAGDAPYDVSASQMSSVISCVGGIQNVQNPYLLGEQNLLSSIGLFLRRGCRGCRANVQFFPHLSPRNGGYSC